MSDYIGNVRSIDQALENAGLRSDDEILAAVFLNGLTDRYETFVTFTTRYHGQKPEINFDDLVERCLLVDRPYKARSCLPERIVACIVSTPQSFSSLALLDHRDHIRRDRLSCVISYPFNSSDPEVPGTLVPTQRWGNGRHQHKRRSRKTK